jgi:hypothetical protein
LLLAETGAGQQVLHLVRAGVAGGLGHRPAVMILQLHQLGPDHVTAGQAGLAAGEAARYPSHEIVEKAPVKVIAYAGASGCRYFVTFHKLTQSRQPRRPSGVPGHL